MPNVTLFESVNFRGVLDSFHEGRRGDLEDESRGSRSRRSVGATFLTV